MVTAGGGNDVGFKVGVSRGMGAAGGGVGGTAVQLVRRRTAVSQNKRSTPFISTSLQRLEKSTDFPSFRLIAVLS
jgi:hypothetical protein